MRIAVCVKQVPNSNQIKVDPVTHNLIRENVEMVVNPADMNALTEAIQIKNTIGGTVDVFTMGVKEADNVLYAVGRRSGSGCPDKSVHQHRNGKMRWLHERKNISLFAISGVCLAARKKMDVLDVIMMGLVTATGGDAIRDSLYDSRVSFYCCLYIIML